MNRLSDAVKLAGMRRSTPSCGCIFCDLNLEPVKMKRQWVHHIPERGCIIVCEFKQLKPGWRIVTA
jgi:hypothetical protein